MLCDSLSNCSPIPLSYYVVHINKRDDESYGLRRVEHYELEYVDKGTGHVIVNGKLVLACDHVLLFRRPGMMVEGVGIYHSHYFEFDFNNNGDVIEDLALMPNMFLLDEWMNVKEIFENIFDDYFSDGLLRILRFKIYVLKLLELMISDWYYRDSISRARKGVKENVDRSIEYIHDHYSDCITIAELSEIAGYSVFHYSRTFKLVTGETPIQFINRVRVQSAKRLLAETNQSVENIINQCGFNNYTYFHRTFRKLCGIGPVQYRLKHHFYE